MSERVRMERRPEASAAGDASARPAAKASPRTAQLAGIGRSLNEGPAAVAQQERATQLSAAPASPGIVQAKLYRGRTLIKKPLFGFGVSKVTESFMDSDKDFVLRADSQLGDKTIHVLDRAYKYLLGEEHGSDQWAKRTTGWDIDTMVEREKGFPEEGARAYNAARTEKDQPLDSIHAYTLSTVLLFQLGLRHLDASWTELKKDKSKADWLDKAWFALLHETKMADDWMGQLKISFGRYETFAEAHKHDASAQNQLIVAFAAKIKATYGPAIQQVDDDFMAFPKDEAGIDALFVKLGLLGPQLRALATDLLAIIGAHPAGSDPERIKALAGGAAPAAPAEHLTATDLHREAVMAANINGARAPVFVKIGNNHLERVQANVADSFAFDKDEAFEDFTRKT